MTVYKVIGAPPFEAGGVHEIVAVEIDNDAFLERKKQG